VPWCFTPSLNTRTIGIVFRFHFFIFHFGASNPTSSVASHPLWSNNSYGAGLPWVATYQSVVGLGDVPFLQSVGAGKYMPGDAPPASFLALKNMTSILLRKMRDPNVPPGGGD